MKRTAISILLCLATIPVAISDDFEPEIVGVDDFSALFKQSPFNRTLNLSGSLVLTGLAQIDDRQVATLLDTSTKETFVVSDQPNQKGWKMVDLKPNNDLERVTAKISIGGEVMSVRYSDSSIKPGETRPGGGSANSSDGKVKGSRKGPPEDIRAKIGSMSEEQRNKFFSKMREFHEKNPEMSQEDRQNASRKLLEKIASKKK